MPKLETNEEFIVVRAKERPVVLIQPELEIGFDNRGYRGRVHRRRCLVGQVFGLADTKTGQTEFSPEFVQRVRKMEYPQLLFLPKKPGLLDVDSILRLDELQSVSPSSLHSYSPHSLPWETTYARLAVRPFCCDEKLHLILHRLARNDPEKRGLVGLTGSCSRTMRGGSCTRATEYSIIPLFHYSIIPSTLAVTTTRRCVRGLPRLAFRSPPPS
jgi:hypothetical protein